MVDLKSTDDIFEFLFESGGTLGAVFEAVGTGG
jgi:hypothetical protein